MNSAVQQARSFPLIFETRTNVNTLRAHTCPGFRTCTSNSLQRNLPFVQLCQVYSAGSHKSPILQPQCNLEYGISAGWCGKTTCMPLRCAHPTTYFSALAKISGWGKNIFELKVAQGRTSPNHHPPIFQSAVNCHASQHGRSTRAIKMKKLFSRQYHI